MKPALSIILIVIVAAGGVPVAAQGPVLSERARGRVEGPISRSIPRAAARLAAQTPPPPRRSRSSRILKDTLIGIGIGAGLAAPMGYGVCSYCTDAGETALLFAAGGAGVGALTGAVVGALGGRDARPLFMSPGASPIEPGTAVMVSVRGAAPAPRYIVNAGDTDIVLLDTTAASLPRDAARALRDLAERHPADLIAAEAGASRSFDNVRLGRDGVFLSNQHVADLAGVLERIPRADIASGRSTIVIPGSKGMGLAGRIGIGIGVGFGAGLFTGAALCLKRCGG